MRILRGDTVAVVVDVQERLFPHIYQHGQLEHNIRTLIQGLTILDIPIVVTQQYTKGLGETIPSVKELIPDIGVIEKMSFSCCGSDDFLRTLYGLGRDNVLLLGIETHVCVMQTALDLLENGYIPIIAEDCVSSRRANDKHIAIERMRAEDAIITTSESLLFELCMVSGTEEFKKISQLVKDAGVIEHS
jgi:nicotinamidase-related amidase